MGFRLSVGPPILVDRVFHRLVAADAMLVAAGAALLAIAAQLSIPIGPVPLTGQSLAVLLAGLMLGWSRGGLAVLLYLLLGGLGLPVFAGSTSGWGVLTGATAGYLFGFLVAVIGVGWMVQADRARTATRAFAILLAAQLLILALGASWLVAVGVEPLTALRDGVLPFLIGEILKATIATAVLALCNRYTQVLDARAVDHDLA